MIFKYLQKLISFVALSYCLDNLQLFPKHENEEKSNNKKKKAIKIFPG